MEKTFIYQNCNINYTVYGAGKTIALLHGFGEDSRIFDTQVNFLKQNHQVVVLDLPGSGKSGLINEGEKAAIEDYADVVSQLLQHEGISSCIMLGHSMGGYITLAFAEKYPELLSAFGLIHSSAAADNDEKKQARQQGINMINEYGPFPFLKNTTPNLFSAGFKTRHPEIINDLIEQGRQFSTKALVRYYSAMMNRPERTDVLENTSLPVLFVLGKEDVAAPLDVVINQVHLPKIAHIHILDNVGHMGMLEAPDQLNQILGQFATFV